MINATGVARITRYLRAGEGVPALLEGVEDRGVVDVPAEALPELEGLRREVLVFVEIFWV